MNLYWSVYKNLEKEFNDLTYSVMFTDSQLKVFSPKIGDLIFRCAAEIESLFKDIYRLETGKEPQKVGDCVSYLDQRWSISKKQISLVCPDCNFSINFKEFAPFGYNNGSPEDYYSAYNAVKHDRVKNLSKANINILVRIMGALFLLNIYYKNAKFSIESLHNYQNFNPSLGSDIFVVKFFDGTGTGFSLPEGTENDTITQDRLSEYVYLVCYPEATYKRICKSYKEAIEAQRNFLKTSPGLLAFERAQMSFHGTHLLNVANEIGGWYLHQCLKDAPDKRQALIGTSEYKQYVRVHNNRYAPETITDENFESICKEIGGWNYINSLFQLQSKSLQLQTNSRMDVELNKGQVLYPPEWRSE